MNGKKGAGRRGGRTLPAEGHRISHSPPGRRWVVPGVKATLGVGLIALIVWKVDPHETAQTLAQARLEWVGAAVAAQAAAKWVWAERWRDILQASGVRPGRWELMRLLLIGLFFNNFLPTGMGGDVVRAAAFGRARRDAATAFGSVLIERALGFIALACLAAGAAAWSLWVDPWLPVRTSRVILGGALAVSGLGALVFARPGWIVAAAAGSLGRWFPPRAREKLDYGLRLFHRSSTPKLRIVLSAFVLQIVAVAFYIASARAVGIQAPSGLFFLAVPVAVLISMIPLSINGLGLREGALVGVLVQHGVPAPQAAAFALLALLISTAFALAGGVWWMASRDPRAREERS